MMVFEAGVEVSFNLKSTYETEVVLTDPNGKTTSIAFIDFVERLGKVNPSSYPTSQPWLETMHKIWLLAANLISKGDIVPHIAENKGSYLILWQPAMLHPEVGSIVLSLAGCIPADAYISKKTLPRPGGEWLLWNMLSTMMTSVGTAHYSNDPLYDFFFLGKPQKFDAIGQGGVAGGIRVWTDKFFLLDSRNEFVLTVEEMKAGFSVGLLVAVSDSDNVVKSHIPFAKFVSDSKFRTRKIETITKLSALSDYLPELRGYIMSEGTRPMEFDSKTFVNFLFKTLPLMRLLGVEVALPKALHNVVAPKAAVRIDKKDAGDGKTYIRLDELLSFSWQISLGEAFVSVEEFNSIMFRAGELINSKANISMPRPKSWRNCASNSPKTAASRLRKCWRLPFLKTIRGRPCLSPRHVASFLKSSDNCLSSLCPQDFRQSFALTSREATNV